MNRKELSARSWLQFDSRNQEFVGVPSLLEVGREEYQLVCSDRNGLSVIDGLVVDVRNRPFSERFGAEFVLEFSDNVESRKIGVVEQLASFFGDSTPHNVVLKSVNEHTVVWLNKSLGNMGCDTPEISWMRSKLTSTEDDDDYVPKEDDYRMGRDGSQASPALKRHFQNFGLTDAYVVLRGSCILKPPSNDADVGEDVGSRDGDSGSIFHGLISGDSLLTFLVPAAIIILMLSLAILLACVLHMKRKAGKLNLFYSESLPPRVPVILQDELIDVDQNAYQKRTVVAASATSNQRLPEFERLIMPKSHNGQMEMSPRPTPAYQFRHT
jgi:dystroglycan 1